VPSADKRQRKKENARQAREAREAAAKRSRRMKTGRNVGIVVLLFAIVVVLINVFSSGSSKKSASTSSTTVPSTTTTVPVSKPDFPIDPSKTYTATVVTSMGNIVLALDTKNAPVAAGHFVKLADAGFYNGSAFTRVVKDFVIQGGAPKGDPSKNYGKPVVGEVPKNHYPVGALAAAKTQTDPPGTFDSEFFIVSGSQGGTLPNDYASFGNVKSGMDVVNKIAALYPASNNNDGKPTTAVPILTISIAET
jgi:cyclophilin family peptidyl-prolyl cis-trans isomerase